MVSETKKAMKMTLSINERTIDQLNEWRTKHVTNRQMTLILAFFIGLFASLAALVLHSIIELIQEILVSRLHADTSNWLFLIFPVIGIFLTSLFVKYLSLIHI